MNTQSIYNTITKAISATVVVMLLLVASPFAGKANTKNEKEAATEKQVSVEYAGANSTAVMFRVQFENADTLKFSLTIKNEAGDILYRGHFNTANFAKTIHLLDEEAEMNPIFIITVGEQKIERSFNINRASDAPDDVVVTKL